MDEKNESVTNTAEKSTTIKDSHPSTTTFMDLAIANASLPSDTYESIAASFEGISNSINTLTSSLDFSGMFSALQAISACTEPLQHNESLSAAIQAVDESVRPIAEMTKLASTVCTDRLSTYTQEIAKVTESIQPCTAMIEEAMKSIPDTYIETCELSEAIPQVDYEIVLGSLETAIKNEQACLSSFIETYNSDFLDNLRSFIKRIGERFTLLHDIVHAALSRMAEKLRDCLSRGLEYLFHSIAHAFHFTLAPPRVALTYNIREHIKGPELKVARRKFMGIAPRIKEQFLRHCRERGSESDLSDYVALYCYST